MKSSLVLLIVCSLAFPVSSQAAEKTYQVHRNLTYVQSDEPHDRQKLDFYVPDEGKQLPVMIWIHGGAWQIGNKFLVNEKPQFFCNQGMILAAINYRLVPDTDYKGQAADVAAAIAWVHTNIARYNGDPNQIFLMGHSAGAHLAALVGIDERYLKAEKLSLRNLTGVILLDGAGYDLEQQIEKLTLPRGRKLYTSVFGEDPAVWKDASPITHVKSGRSIPPFLILYVASRPASRIQSENLAKALRAAEGKAETFAAENKTHATINRELGLPEDPATQRVEKFLKELSAGN